MKKKVNKWSVAIAVSASACMLAAGSVAFVSCIVYYATR